MHIILLSYSDIKNRELSMISQRYRKIGTYAVLMLAALGAGRIWGNTEANAAENQGNFRITVENGKMVLWGDKLKARKSNEENKVEVFDPTRGAGTQKDQEDIIQAVGTICSDNGVLDVTSASADVTDAHLKTFCAAGKNGIKIGNRTFLMPKP
jgi:hypothetical protein